MGPFTFTITIIIIVATSATFLLELTHALSPSAPPPKIYTTASAIPDPPSPDKPFVPSPFDDFLLSIFRWTLQRQSGVIHPEVKGFEGMISELHELRQMKGTDELERVSSQTMTALAGPITFIYRNLFAEWEATPALLAWFACQFLTFLVGDMELTSLDENDGRCSSDSSKGGGLLVKRCRVLEQSNCKGICAKMCKVPTERFFAERWGIPLSMEPNFETGACQLRFGVEPMDIGEDPTIPSGCLNRCPRMTSGIEPNSSGASEC